MGNIRRYNRTVKRGNESARVFNIEIRVDIEDFIANPLLYLDDAFSSRWITKQGQLRKLDERELLRLEAEGLDVRIEDMTKKTAGPKMNIPDTIEAMARNLEETMSLDADEALKLATKVVMASIR